MKFTTTTRTLSNGALAVLVLLSVWSGTVSSVPAGFKEERGVGDMMYHAKDTMVDSMSGMMSGMMCMMSFFTHCGPYTSSRPPVVLTTVPTTPSTTTPTTTTMPLPTTSNCQKMGVVQDIANRHINQHSGAISCSSGARNSHEAFVLSHCNVKLPGSWAQGRNVLQSCNSLPLYTAVAVFHGGVYNHVGGYSGVLMGCLPNGFMLGAQHCGTAPTIEHAVTGGSSKVDPASFYVIA